MPTSFLASTVVALGGRCSLFRSTFPLSDENASKGEEVEKEEEEKEEGPWMAAIAIDSGVCIARESEHHNSCMLTCTMTHFLRTTVSILMLRRQDYVYFRLSPLFHNQVMKMEQVILH